MTVEEGVEGFGEDLLYLSMIIRYWYNRIERKSTFVVQNHASKSPFFRPRVRQVLRRVS